MDLALLIKILVILLFVVALAWLWIKGYKQKVIQIIKHFVIAAEEQYGSGTGTIKFEMVLSWIYQELPSLITFIIGKTKLKDYIEKAVSFIQDTKTDGDVTIEEYLCNLVLEQSNQ